MKELSEALKKLSPDAMGRCSTLLGLKGSSPRDIAAAMIAPKSLDRLLAGLTPGEIMALREVYRNPAGLTFGELEKRIGKQAGHVEEMAGHLSERVLAYVTKNRQLLNNRMDRIYPIAELARLICIMPPDEVADRLRAVYERLRHCPGTERVVLPVETHHRAIIACIAGAGCVVTLGEAAQCVPAASFNGAITSLLDAGVLSIIQTESPETRSLVMLAERYVESAAALIEPPEPPQGIIRNRCFLLLNLLAAYDTITSCGLFLTKQNEFRKIDLKRIADAMIPLYDFQGRAMDHERIARLALWLLRRLGCLNIRKDITHATLSSLAGIIDDPTRLLAKLLTIIDGAEPAGDPLFPLPIDMPRAEVMKEAILFVSRCGTTAMHFLAEALLVHVLAGRGHFFPEVLSANRETVRSGIRASLSVLTIMGILENERGTVRLSGAGVGIARMLGSEPASAVEPSAHPSIYINPDFTLVIPVEELDDTALYHLLTHTEITKHDVVLHARVTKVSITRARKRGMAIDTFLSVLRSRSRNDLPQNMDFLLTEWDRQTLSVDFSEVIMVRSSQPGFIDELAYGKRKDLVVERISDTCAVTRRDAIDDIVKMARKKDAVISLFNDDGGNS